MTRVHIAILVAGVAGTLLGAVTCFLLTPNTVPPEPPTCIPQEEELVATVGFA